MLQTCTESVAPLSSVANPHRGGKAGASVTGSHLSGKIGCEFKDAMLNSGSFWLGCGLQSNAV